MWIRAVGIGCLLLSALCWPASSVRAQTPANALAITLCDCFSAVDAGHTDPAFARHVERCLELAMLSHPAAFSDLLDRADGGGSAGYRMGRMLGTLLDGRCAAFPLVRERLRKHHENAVLKKGPS